MIPAQGAQLTVSNDSIQIHYSELLTALYGSDVEVEVSRITGINHTSPTALTSGAVQLVGPDLTITFAPNQQDAAAEFQAAVQAALRGEATGAPMVPGLNFVGFDVETANDDWGSICQIGVVRYIDGVEVAAESWLCTPPPGLEHFTAANIRIHGIRPEDVADQPTFAQRLPQLIEFIGDLPFLAHFAQFDATALFRACAAAGIEAPALFFGCSLALARREQLPIRSHSLPFVAEHLGVELKKHHDATEDARACAGITVALARANKFQGTLAELFHSRNMTIGTLSPERVYPVLRDRSGAGIALQQRRFAAGLAAAGARIDEAAEDPTGGGTPDAGSRSAWEDPVVARSGADSENALLTEDEIAAEAPASARRGPAPWAAVATPDTIPEPNEQADPNGILFGQHVTLSGDFDPFEKGSLWAGIAERGGLVGKNVTKKTTILVAGTWATKTSKQKRAEELIAKGQDIAIWTAAELYTAIGFDEQPPF
ncbi:exonuclease domain-containing protein [Corynebacterium sp. A21]|uniref:exonuclease domain-containing protein n=1 Tax=Corynebacterium sp. A21 TaxID=3457318 RepID=UPI003FCF0B67